MNDNERELSNKFCNNDSNKLQSNEQNKSVNVIENLSNELFYEIFDYLDGCDIYEIFSNLNNRFQNLLFSSLLHLKINLTLKPKSTLQHTFEQIIMPNRHQIVSFYISGRSRIKSFMKYITLNSSFDCLQSLTINCMEKIKFKPFLLNLYSLPRLYSLTINIYKSGMVLADLYLPIFRLPMLKYTKISSRTYSTDFHSHRIVSTKKFSGVEYLHINHYCTFNTLIDILSYTPKLRRLICNRLSDRTYIGIIKKIPKTLSNLTHLTVSNCDMLFKDFYIFIRQISFQLQVLRITVSHDQAYLNADHWKLLIVQYLPYLRKFEFHCRDLTNQNFVLQPYHKLINRFVSPFWIERQWFLEFKIDSCSYPSSITYSIVPYKLYTKHNIYSEKDIHTTINPSIQLFQGVKFNFRPSRDAKNDHLYIKNISAIFTVVQITILNIDGYCSKQLLLNILLLLPNLNCLSILSFSLIELSDELEKLYQSALNTNKIIKVNFKKMTKFEQIYFLIDLCHRMEYLEVKYNINIDLELLVRFILMKHNTQSIPHLRSLCLCNSTNDDVMVQKLENMIDEEKSLNDYTIKRVLDRIYLVWK